MPSLPLLAVVLMLVAAIVPARAQGVADAYTVKGVEVDVSAANPQAAKDQAIAEGQRQAFRTLLERLTVPADHARLPKDDGLAHVRDFVVDQERSSTTRYLATLSVRFNPAGVRRLLQAAGIAFVEARSRPVVVAPVFRPTGGPKAVLWDDPNPWRAAWAMSGGGGLVPIVVPGGDLSDIAAMTPEQALAGAPEAMRALGGRWKTPDVLVAAAAFSGKTLDVALIAEPGTPKPFETRSYALADGESPDGLMVRAARDVARGLDTLYKQPNLLDFAQVGQVAALVPLSGLEEWLQVRQRLARVAPVRRWELVSLSRVEAAVILHTVGGSEQVRAALESAGLTLRHGDGFWTLTVATGRS